MTRVIGRIFANCPVCDKEYVVKLECPVCGKLYTENSERVQTKFGGILVCPICSKKEGTVPFLESLSKVQQGYDETTAVQNGKSEVVRTQF
jgi:transcription elongation factor Elf1